MSLKVWLPFTDGTCNNKGTGNYNISPVNSPILDRNGKLGKCLGRVGNSTGVSISSNLINDLGNEYSFAIWVCPLGNHVHYNGTFISSGNWNVSCWAFGVNQNNTSVDVAGPGYNKYISCNIPINNWTHLACTVKNGISTLYKNGVYVGEKSLSNNGILKSDTDWTCVQRETYASGYFSFNGKINDLRIYNHCLSIAEIKELSRGLVAHYSFSNIPNLNLLKNANVYCRKDASGGTDYASYSFELDKLKSLPVGTKLTVSCRVKLHNIKSLSRLGIEPSFTKETSGYMYYGAWRSDKTDCDTVLSNTYTLSSKITGTSQCGIYIQGATFNSGGYAEVSHPKLEIGDHRTEWYHSYSEGPHIIEDNSGNGYSGNIIGYSIDDNNSIRGNSSMLLNGHRNPYLEFRKFLDNDSLKDCTISYWINWSKPTSLLFTGQSTYEYYLMAGNTSSNFWHTTNTVGSNIEVFKDGVKGIYKPTTDGWHFFTLRHVDLSKWTVAYINNHDTNWHNTGNISDLRIYSTPLSNEDIMKLYNSPTKINNKNILMINGEFIEGGLQNIAAKAEQSRAQKKWENGISNYTQSNCQCTLTDDGYRIYRGPNLTPSANGNTMWGGFVLDNTNNHLGLTKGHSYIFMLDIKGKTSNEASEFYWSNLVGWGSGGLEPHPETISRTYPPTNFNSTEFKTFHYAFKISDDVYKKCTKAYDRFKLGETYISYKGLKLGFGYWNTGSMGTDLYIKNIRFYDITELSSKQVSKFCKTGNIKCTELNELRNICEINKYGNLLSYEFIES